MQRWKKCIEKQGDCVEKLCYYEFSIFIEIKFVSVVRIIIDSRTYFLRVKPPAEGGWYRRPTPSGVEVENGEELDYRFLHLPA